MAGQLASRKADEAALSYSPTKPSSLRRARLVGSNRSEFFKKETFLRGDKKKRDEQALGEYE